MSPCAPTTPIRLALAWYPDAQSTSAPRALPRLIRLPQTVPGTGPNDFVFLSSVIHAHVDQLFPGMAPNGCYQFRVTRNSDLFVDEEEVKNLRIALQGELPQRHFGDAGLNLSVAITSLVDAHAPVASLAIREPMAAWRARATPWSRRA